MQASSAISFHLPSRSFSAAASLDSPLLSSFRFLASLGSTSFRFVSSASFRRLSDPRCFRSLSLASVLGSDYSASVSSFPFFPFPPHSGFPGAPFRFRFQVFLPSFRPGFPCLLSGSLYSASLFVSLRPSLLRSHSCSTGAYLLLSFVRFRYFLLPVRFLSSASLPFPATRPSVSSFPCSSPLCLTVAFRLLLRFFRCSGFPFPFHPVSRVSLSVPVLGFLLVSFHPSQFRSRSCSTGARLSVSLRRLSFALLSFVRSALGF